MSISQVSVPELRAAIRAAVNNHTLSIPPVCCGTRPGAWVSTATRLDIETMIQVSTSPEDAEKTILATIAAGSTPALPLVATPPVSNAIMVANIARDASIAAIYTPLGDGMDAMVEAMFQGEHHPQIPSRPHHFKHLHDPLFIKRVYAEWRVNGSREGRKPIVLIGMPGTGKSAGLEALAARANRPLYRVSLGLGTRQDDLIGRWILTNGSTTWQDGVLTRAMREGAWLLLDEIDSAQDGILASLYEALEPGGSLTLKEKDGERVSPAPGFWLFATANSLGTDELGQMTHSRACSPALLSRFLGYKVPDMTPEREAEILVRAWEVDTKTAVRVAGAAHAIRELGKRGRLNRLTWGVRESVDVALLRGAGLDWQEAFCAVYQDKTVESEGKEAWEAAKRFLADDVDLNVEQEEAGSASPF